MCTATPPQVFALIRYSDDPQRFSIEYSNGQVRRYAATERYVSMPAELCISGAELLIMSAGYSSLSAGYSSVSAGYSGVLAGYSSVSASNCIHVP